jgi:type I restriction-modification system DNA methylase subunit/restriction endonuclease S subunit
MDYKKLSDDELIELCKQKSIEYFNSKTKKNYARTTLISKIKKLDIDKEIITTDKIIQEEIVNIEYKNEIIWTLSDEDKKNNDDYKEIESKLLNCIKSCHDCLYSNGAIIGIKASNDIIRIIIFRLFNIIYKNDDIKLEIKNKISNENLEKFEKYLIDIKEFNKSLNIDNDIKIFIMKIIMPILPNVFNSDDMIFNMRNYPKNYTTIINKISELIDINNSELFIKLFADTGGNIYEYFTNSYGKGNSSKELGQFFTPFKLINLLLFNIKDYISIDDDYSIYDPCCGSGGLLNRTSSFLNINKNNIYGCEIEKDTIKYALASLLFNNNYLKINILNKCSLSNNNYLFENKKFNLILTNPPFGIKMTYKDLKSKFEEYRDYNYKSSLIKFEDVYPINTNNGPCLFLQHVIYMLEDNGICGIVLPDGNELTNNSFYNIRKYLIDNCKILKVINVSGGAFNSTNIKTKILIFKKQKEIDNHKNIEFLEINKDCNEVKLIAIADLDKNYSFKLKANQEIIKYNSNVEIKTLGKIFDLKMGKFNSNDMDNIGDIPFYSCKSDNPCGYHSVYSFDYIEYLLLVCAGGSQNNIIGDNVGLGKCYYVNGKTACRANVCSLISKIKEINIKYIYYYLNINRLETNKKAHFTTNLGTISLNEISNLKIPIPSIEKQEEIIKKIDIFENSNKDIIKLIENLKEFNKIKLESSFTKDIEIKTLDEVCTFKNGINITKDKLINGDYPVIGGGQKPLGYHNEYNRNENIILCSSSGSYAGFISKYDTKIWASDCFSIIPINNSLNNNYLYYYLKSIQNSIYEIQSGTGQPHIYSKDLLNIKILIPSIEVQEEIIDYCDNNFKIIENLNKTIEGNKKIIKDIMNSI